MGPVQPTFMAPDPPPSRASPVPQCFVMCLVAVAAAYVGMFDLRCNHSATDFQALQDPALFDIRPFAAALAQVDELRLQGEQAVDPCLDVVDVFVDQGVHAFALVLWTVAQAQQAADFFEGHVQGAAVADEGQALGMGLGVDAVVAVAAGRLRQQVFALVVADGFHGAVGEFRQFSDLHDGNLQMGA